MQELHGVASTLLPPDKAQEMNTILGEFLLDLTTITGPNAPVIPEIPKVSILDTRAALMILLISLVIACLVQKHSQAERDLWSWCDR